MSKIIMWSRVQDHHGIVVRREAIGCSAMSTGPSGDCETPFFPHDEATSLSTRTLQGVRACLNRAVRRAMARDKVKRNVVEITEVPAGLPGRPSKALTAQQADDVITKTASDRMHPYIVVSLLTGARTEKSSGWVSCKTYSACPTSTPHSESALMTRQRIWSDNAFVGGVTGPRVLIVDDHDGFRAVTRTLLESEGFDVVGEAADGVDAVRATERLTPALVLLDVHLPDEDGFAVTERLAALAEPPAVVLISSRLIADLRQRVHDSPAVGFLAKHELTGAGLRAMVELR
jgi:CheY-like chemotaxis protein